MLLDRLHPLRLTQLSPTVHCLTIDHITNTKTLLHPSRDQHTLQIDMSLNGKILPDQGVSVLIS